jgi:hypothetical protein
MSAIQVWRVIGPTGRRRTTDISAVSDWSRSCLFAASFCGPCHGFFLRPLRAGLEALSRPAGEGEAFALRATQKGPFELPVRSALETSTAVSARPTSASSSSRSPSTPEYSPPRGLVHYWELGSTPSLPNVFFESSPIPALQT